MPVSDVVFQKGFRFLFLEHGKPGSLLQAGAVVASVLRRRTAPPPLECGIEILWIGKPTLISDFRIGQVGGEQQMLRFVAAYVLDHQTKAFEYCLADKLREIISADVLRSSQLGNGNLLIKMFIAIGQHSVKTIMQIQVYVFILIFVIKPVKEFEKDFNQTIGGRTDVLRLCWVRGSMLHVGKGQKNIFDLIHCILLIRVTMTAFTGKKNVLQAIPGQMGPGKIHMEN